MAFNRATPPPSPDALEILNRTPPPPSPAALLSPSSSAPPLSVPKSPSSTPPTANPDYREWRFRNHRITENVFDFEISIHGNTALKRVVESIANGDSHMPFRDNKLTMLLQQ